MEITKEIAKFNLSDAKIAEMRKLYLKMEVRSLDDKVNYEACKSAHQEVLKLRVGIETRRVESKADFLAAGRAIDAEAKRLTAELKEIEDYLLTQRQVVENEKKRIKEEKDRRIKEEEDRLKKEEEDRLEAQRVEQEEKEATLKAEQDKLEADRVALAKEKEDVRLEKEKIAKEKADAETARLKAIQDEKDRVAREKKHAEEVEQAKKEAAEKAKKEERERQEKEAKEKEEAEELERLRKIEEEAKASDKDKLVKLANDIGAMVFPNVKSNSAKKRLAQVGDLLLQAEKILIKEV